MSSTIYLETGSCDPRWNLAFEEYILTHKREGDYLLLWQNDNTIVIGQNQNAEAEINRSFVEAHGITVVRRMTGGGAVYHDLGNLNYSFITDAGDVSRLSMAAFTAPVVKALKALGLEAEASGRNDILVGGKKVSGTAQRLARDRVLHHGTLLFDSDPAMVAGALHVDPEKFRSKSAKSVRSRIGNIRPQLAEDMDLQSFWAYLKGALAEGGFAAGELTEAELAEVRRLKESKYDTWEWNFGRSPRFDFTNKRRFDGGTLEVGLEVGKGGVIQSAVFYGDFLSLTSLEPLAAALVGCPFRAETVRQILERFPLREMFGTLEEDQILETMFHAGDRVF